MLRGEMPGHNPMRYSRNVLLVALLMQMSAPLCSAGDGGAKISSPFETPKLSEPMAVSRFFDTDRFLTNAGVMFSASDELTLEPELGIGYRGTGQELHGGLEQSSHRLHARAGWRLSLAETLYLSAAAKLSMVTVESTGLTGGAELGTRPDVGARAGYEFGNFSRGGVRWTGEVGLRLSPRTDLMLYYDQDPLSGWSYSGQHQEERIGTRFIIRFK